MSFKVEVLVAGESEWASNALRFATKKEAEDYGADLWRRWTAVKKYRIVVVDEPVNCRFTKNGLEFLRWPIEEINSRKEV